MQSRDEITVHTEAHERGWIVVPTLVGGMFELRWILNTGHAMSSLSTATGAVLSALGHLDHMEGRNYRLRDVTLADQRVPDHQVRSGQAVNLLALEGILGLDFLRQFHDVHFNVPAGLLTLSW
ncbi:MAG: hypothetical protein ACR2PL_07975 [Dehalococcoidia bacterium]